MSRKCPYVKKVLITGASSGIGRETALLFARHGFLVYAASRHPLDEKEENIIPLQMDVTDFNSVQEAEKKVDELGIIIHCAGFGISGSAELTSLERAKAQMDTNYFGVLNVNNVFMKKLRQQKNSLVLITGSIAGLVPIPFQSHYSSSKYALEAYTQALRMESACFGVRACIVEPGDTKTGFTKARSYDEPEDSPYLESCKVAVQHMEKDERNGKSASTVSDVFLKLCYRKNPPVRCAVGFSYKALALLAKILPARIVLALIKAIYLESK